MMRVCVYHSKISWEAAQHMPGEQRDNKRLLVTRAQPRREEGSTRNEGAILQAPAADTASASRQTPKLAFFLRVLFFSSSPDELIKATTGSFFRKTLNSLLRKLQLVNSVGTATNFPNLSSNWKINYWVADDFHHLSLLQKSRKLLPASQLHQLYYFKTFSLSLP